MERIIISLGERPKLDLTPLKGLTLTAVFAPRYTFETGKKFTKAVNVYYEDGSSIAAQSNKTTSLNETRNMTQSRTYQFYANYQNKWTDHSLNAMVGYEGISINGKIWVHQEIIMNWILILI